MLIWKINRKEEEAIIIHFFKLIFIMHRY